MSAGRRTPFLLRGVLADGGNGYNGLERRSGSPDHVMAGHSRPKGRRAFARLCPGHPRLACWLAGRKTWMPGTRPGMTA